MILGGTLQTAVAGAGYELDAGGWPMGSALGNVRRLRIAVVRRLMMLAEKVWVQQVGLVVVGLLSADN